LVEQAAHKCNEYEDKWKSERASNENYRQRIKDLEVRLAIKTMECESAARSVGDNDAAMESNFETLKEAHESICRLKLEVEALKKPDGLSVDSELRGMVDFFQETVVSGMGPAKKDDPSKPFVPYCHR